MTAPDIFRGGLRDGLQNRAERGYGFSAHAPAAAGIVTRRRQDPEGDTPN